MTNTSNTLLGLLLFLASYNCAATSINFFTEEAPPYSYIDDNNNLVGYAVEILQSMNDNLGVKQPIKLLEWDRAYNLVQLPREDNALFLMIRNKRREKMFKWVGPVVKSKVGLFCNKKLNFKQQNIPFYNYSAIRDGVGQILLEDLGVPLYSIHQLSKFYQLHSFVVSHRADCFAYEINVTNWLMNANNLDTANLYLQLELNSDDLYYAFNRSVSQSIIDKYARSFAVVAKNKKLMQMLRNKYNIS